MAITVLDLFYKQNDFKFKNGIAYGFYKERLFAIHTESAKIRITTIVSRLQNDNILQQLDNDFCRAIQANPAYINSEYGSFSLMCYLDLTKANEPLIVDAINVIVEILDEYNVPKRDVCPICGQQLTPSDPFYYFDEELFQIHETCSRPLIQSIDSAMTLRYGDRNKQHYFTGILGVLLAGLIFVFLYLLLEATHYFACIASLIGVFLAHFFYKKFNGKMVKNRLFIISIILELFVILAEYCLLVFVQVKADQSLGYAMLHPFRNLDILQLIVHLILNTVFVYGAFLFLYKAEKQISSEIKKI